ncbi:MAG: YggT family protein [Alphaproteobacteria bacterium]|nr:YggT family protein [Alphaproteobacteria bacterium]
MLYPIYWFIDSLLLFFILAIFVRVLMSWLINFDVADRGNPAIRAIDDASVGLTDWAFRPVRRMLQRFLPDLGGVDVAPLIVLLLAFVTRMYLAQIFIHLQ